MLLKYCNPLHNFMEGITQRSWKQNFNLRVLFKQNQRWGNPCISDLVNRSIQLCPSARTIAGGPGPAWANNKRKELEEKSILPRCAAQFSWCTSPFITWPSWNWDPIYLHRLVLPCLLSYSFALESCLPPSNPSHWNDLQLALRLWLSTALQDMRRLSFLGWRWMMRRESMLSGTLYRPPSGKVKSWHWKYSYCFT